MSRWYEGGLRFECTRCAGCCTGPQGHVWLSPRDQEAIARYLGLSTEAFLRRYARLVGRLLSLVDKPNGDCIFLAEDKRCAIQPAKPRQCLTFPFWPRLLESQASWQEVVQTCPGVGKGALYRPEEIDALQDRDTPREVLWKLVSGNGRTPR